MTELSRRAAQAARRLADQNTDRINEIPLGRLWVLTVTAVAAGASPKGNPRITVRWRGSSIVATDYCASYTPAVNDRVLCAHLPGGTLVVLDRFAG